MIGRLMPALAATLLLCPAAARAGENPPRTEAQRRAKRQSEQFFARHDRNKDGKLLRDELPAGARRLFDAVDADKNGAITPAEDIAFRTARASRTGRGRPATPAPDWANEHYGPHERNVLDLWQTPGAKPAPLVIYYHGGGFRGGDKRTINPRLLSGLLAGGVSVAAVNYRLTQVAPFPAQMHDCARALQFLRHHAKKYKIDPRRIGATGGSAGAGISLWLAFHDDLADPAAKNPVARQSTRLAAAVVYGAQSSYDPRFIRKLFDTTHVEGALIPLFGMRNAADIDNPKFHPLFVEASAINHASADDAPVMLFYPQANTPLPKNSRGMQHIHHPKFGIVLKKKLDGLGVECVLKFRKDFPRRNPVDEYVKFFLAKLAPPKP